MSSEPSYLGRGWSFPPSFEPPLPSSSAASGAATGGVQLVSGLTDIEQSLHILLTTRLGERVLAPDYGCDLHTLVFEPLNAGLEAQIQHLIQTAVLTHEPRIYLLGVSVSQSPTQSQLLLLDLEFQVRSTNARHNYVYPFYLQEGSELGLGADPGSAPAAPRLG